LPITGSISQPSTARHSYFAASFVAPDLIFIFAAWTRRLRFGYGRRVRGAAGIALLVYAAVVYPLLGLLLGHAAAALPSFGVTPCPLTIFTLGCLLLTTTPVPWWVLVVPVLWSFVGGSAAFLLGVPQDMVLLVSASATRVSAS
jgi:hypothetical protein